MRKMTYLEYCQLYGRPEQKMDLRPMQTQTKKRKLEITATIDFMGYSDYWSGHGHAFAPDNLVACIRFGTQTNYSETPEDLLEALMDDITGTWFIEYLKDEQQYKEAIQELGDQEFGEAVKEAIQEDVDWPSYSTEDLPQDLEDLDELPMVIGQIHIYEVEE